jgi:hypothetical protein
MSGVSIEYIFLELLLLGKLFDGLDNEVFSHLLIRVRKLILMSPLDPFAICWIISQSARLGDVVGRSD